ncbi:MAG: hypothetical protein NTW10_12915 [Bacteroidetes bacterium]|nr:hypothetical protein [Bacteroidota bacterium]
MKKIAILGICLLMIASVACKKKTEDPAPVPYAYFKVDGVAKSYTVYSKFTKDLCSTSTFCCRFSSNNTETAAQMKFGIPGDPVVGLVYKTGDYRFSCFYFDDAQVRYDFATAPFSVVFTQWDGQGGWARGNFSGWLKSPTNDSIHITDGYFQNMIWTMGTK